ncbi:MAG TPA: MBL fold metallo-hydrolase, partial [Candidatus Goldiibacteriota bacterium]|nr:MBL fold metallo-hydrolase [Candidatus Goldiibacteriota bacterium]
ALLIDTPAEFRLASLSAGINRIDAVLLTHAHADHVAGFDDIRRYNELSGMSMPVYSSAATLYELRKRFGYIFESTQEGGGKPKVVLFEVGHGKAFECSGISVTPIRVMHGETEVMAFRAGGFAYVTDVSYIPQDSIELLRGLDVLVLDALRPEPHPTHFNLETAVRTAGLLAAKRTFFTHIAHRLKHEETEKKLPKGMFLAYDGLKVES